MIFSGGISHAVLQLMFIFTVAISAPPQLVKI
jgi:hypothetical protein